MSPDDASLQTIPESEVSGNDADAKMALLQAQLSALQSQMDELKKNQSKATPTWKGAPQWSEESGWSFKLRGRLQLDAGYIGMPPHYNAKVAIPASASAGVEDRTKQRRSSLAASHNFARSHHRNR